MKGIKQLAATAAVAITVAASFQTSAFADSRNRNETRRDNRGGYGDRDRSSNQREQSYRNNERVTTQGRITSMNRERDGYRVQLDRDRYSYWVPERYARRYSNNWRIGLGISLGGIFRNGAIYVDVVNDYPYDGRYDNGRYDDRYGYGRNTVSGVVDRVDYRRGIAVIRDDYSRRLVTVEMRSRSGYRDVGLDDVRRGDYVEISGNWDRGGVFEGYRVESVRQGRY
jgi:hypothetical protein